MGYRVSKSFALCNKAHSTTLSQTLNTGIASTCKEKDEGVTDSNMCRTV